MFLWVKAFKMSLKVVVYLERIENYEGTVGICDLNKVKEESEEKEGL